MNPYIRRFTRLVCIFSLASLIPLSVYAQDDVNNKELEEHQAPVEFISNTQMPARIDSRAAIWGIGNSLGRQVGSGSNRAGDAARYFVIHCVPPAQTDKLGADIFGLGPNAGVDHIKNLRLIIQGYLEGAYGYSAGDAALLAEFITVYNAVFRKNIAYMTDTYISEVSANLTAEKTGLDTRYDQWPGKTLIVIPIGNAESGSLSAVNTTPLTEPEVIDKMREDPDKGVESRKDMVDLKEREADEAEKKAAAQQAAAEKEEAAIAQEREQLAQEKQQAANQPGTRQPAAEAAIAQKEAELDQREAAAAAQKEAAAANQQLAEQKAAEARQERQDIAKDQQRTIADEGATTAVFALGVTLNNALSPLGKIVQLDTRTGKQVKTSEPVTVNGRTITFLKGSIYALAAINDGTYRLTKIASDTLDTADQGTDAISANSLLWNDGTSLYAIGASGPASFYLARFDTNLKLLAKSAVAVHPFATVIFYNNVLLSERANGDVLFLDPQDLTERIMVGPLPTAQR